MKMMRIQFVVSILIAAGLGAQGQEMKELFPTSAYQLEFSPELEREFYDHLLKCNMIWDKISDQKDLDKLSKEDKDYLNNCSEVENSYWAIIDGGCSWYCGGGPDSVTASSQLPDFMKISYNAHDLSYKTAWVEGVEGNGEGEYLLYHFAAQSPRITEIIVVNGYAKNKAAWKNNSRVKRIKLHIDDKPYAFLNLVDECSEQIFKVDTLGNDRNNITNELIDTENWTLKFEIIDVYQGDKYNDAAITEIYFNGIDVH